MFSPCFPSNESLISFNFSSLCSASRSVKTFSSSLVRIRPEGVVYVVHVVSNMLSKVPVYIGAAPPVRLVRF